MKVYIDKDLCIDCGVCIDTAPDVFDYDDDGQTTVIVDEVPADQEELVLEAIDSCPTEAIKEM